MEDVSNNEESDLDEDQRTFSREFDLSGDQISDERAPTDEDREEEQVVVFRVSHSSMLRLDLMVQEKKITAVVDTAAEVTIISNKIYKSLQDKPALIKRVTLNTAERNATMSGFICGPLQIRIADNLFEENVYVAPLQDDMLLGLDFMRKHCMLINIPESYIVVKDDKIPLTFLDSGEKVAHVTVCQTTKIPPNTCVRIPCRVSEPLDSFMIEAKEGGELIIPPTACSKEQSLELCVMNVQNHHITVSKDEDIGQAVEICEVPPIPEEISEFGINGPVTDQGDGQTALPSHLEELFERARTHLEPDQQDKVRDLLIEFQDVFARDEFDLGEFTAVEHGIDTGTATPVKQRLRRTPLSFADEEEAHLQKMLKAGVIQPSTSNWASAPVLVRKRDGTVRWCVDYRSLNEKTVKDVYPLPLVEECMDMLAGNVWYSKLDANSAYWQIRIRPEDCKKTAFLTKYGLFEFVRMAFGLCNSPATFSRAMNLVLQGLTWREVLSFLDDILALGKSFNSHLETLRQIFLRFRQYQLKLKPRKCELFQKFVEFLGRVVGPDGLEIGSADVEQVAQWEEPTNIKELQRFLGLVNYHRSFIPDYAHISNALYQMVGSKEFRWELEHEEAFRKLKESLVNPPILTLPNSTDPFILDTDASDFAIGGVLSQVQEGKERVVCYGSYSLTPEQKRYCTTRKELLAVVRFTRQFRHYLLGKPFEVRTDHNSLTWLLRFKDPQGQIARWLEELSQYDMRVTHRPGKNHGNADALSRKPNQDKCGQYKAGVALEDLPCGGCRYCLKAHTQWKQFEDEVDEVVPLTRVSCVNLQTGVEELGSVVNAINTAKGMSVQLLNEECSIQAVSPTSDPQSPGVWDFSHKRVKQAQSTEGEIAHVIDWLTNGTEPPQLDLYLSGPVAKYYWINRNLFILQNGLVWRNDPKTGREQLFVPESLRTEVMYMCHNLPMSGHQGEDRTLLRLKDRYYWKGMTKDTREYVRSCAVCNRHKKPNKKAKHEMVGFHAGAPLERVHLDFLGPLPKTARGNEYVLMIVDQFTKWVECLPLPSQTAEQTAAALVDQFIARFGCPLQIFTDRGSNFESNLFTEVCELLRIHKTRTTPYRPSANGQVERYNRTLMDAVRCFVGRNQASWDLLMPQIAAALRSSVNRHTGYTPNKLMFGREVNTPVDLLFATVTNREGVEVNEFVKDLENNIQESHRLVREQLKQQVGRMKRYYDLKLHVQQYKPGDAVYILNTATVKGQNRKLGAPWKGPGVVEQRITSYLYRVRIPQRNSITINHDRMKLCKDRNLPAWVKKVQREVKSRQTGEPSSKDLRVNHDTLSYCLCGREDDGQFMIQCDMCDDWFHGRCVNITAEDAKQIESFVCDRCDSGSN